MKKLTAKAQRTPSAETGIVSHFSKSGDKEAISFQRSASSIFNRQSTIDNRQFPLSFAWCATSPRHCVSAPLLKARGLKKTMRLVRRAAVNDHHERFLTAFGMTRRALSIAWCATSPRHCVSAPLLKARGLKKTMRLVCRVAVNDQQERFLTALGMTRRALSITRWEGEQH